MLVQSIEQHGVQRVVSHQDDQLHSALFSEEIHGFRERGGIQFVLAKYLAAQADDHRLFFSRSRDVLAVFDRVDNRLRDACFQCGRLVCALQMYCESPSRAATRMASSVMALPRMFPSRRK